MHIPLKLNLNIFIPLNLKVNTGTRDCDNKTLCSIVNYVIVSSPVGCTSSLEEPQIASVVNQSTHAHQRIHYQVSWLHRKLSRLEKMHKRNVKTEAYRSFKLVLKMSDRQVTLHATEQIRVPVHGYPMSHLNTKTLLD